MIQDTEEIITDVTHVCHNDFKWTSPPPPHPPGTKLANGWMVLWCTCKYVIFVWPQLYHSAINQCFVLSVHTKFDNAQI